VAAIGLAGLLAGCGGGGDGAAPEPPTTTTSGRATTTTTTAPAVGEPIVADLAARTVTPANAEGWELAFCEGEAPMVCLSKPARTDPSGVLELTTFPLDSFPSLQGKTGQEALEALAAEAVRTFVADRKEGCGIEYVVEGDETQPQTVAGTDGLRYGWTAPVGDAVAERSVTYAAIDGDTILLLGTGALPKTRGCIERISEFLLEDFDSALPVLDRVAAGFRR
jgi:hypothetical protein